MQVSPLGGRMTLRLLKGAERTSLLEREREDVCVACEDVL